ncbi:MAG: hypothetical protein LBH43_17295 [Treponema sp.]|jgi:hypothetical protein|nr:hypothetical protein [Treponema sp.]
MRLAIRIRPVQLAKAHRDISKLAPKVIIDKNGHARKVYVKLVLAVKKEKRVEDSKIIETEHEKCLSIYDLKKECFGYAREHFQGKTFTNKDTGREIIVSKDGLGEWKSKSKTHDQILSIKILDKLLENGIFDHDMEDKKDRKNIEKISYFHSSCMIGNNRYNAVITIRKIKNYGDKYYHHYLEDIKIEPCSGITRPAGETG